MVDGALLTTLTGLEVTGALVARPSEAVTRTRMASPLLPLPRTLRSSVAAVAPAMSVPFFDHW